MDSGASFAGAIGSPRASHCSRLPFLLLPSWRRGRSRRRSCSCQMPPWVMIIPCRVSDHIKSRSLNLCPTWPGLTTAGSRRSSRRRHNRFLARISPDTVWRLTCPLQVLSAAYMLKHGFLIGVNAAQIALIARIPFCGDHFVILKHLR